MFFLSHHCQSPFPHWESQSTSSSKVALQHCVDLWTCYGDHSDFNLALLLCVLASNVHKLSELVRFLLQELSITFYYSIDRVCLVDHVNLICSLYSWWKGFRSYSLDTLHLGFNSGFIPTSTCRLSTGVCS